MIANRWTQSLFVHQCLLAGVGLLTCLSMLGCSGPEHPDVGRVSGKVTLDGQPLAEATVMFQPSTGRASMATTDSDGNYTLSYIDQVSGAIIGSHKVIIRTEIPGEDGQPPVAKEKLPKKYHDRSELTADVKAGSNTFDFELASK
ncbi:MAG: carboxypeptidase regulatory-like domain-containing protein [Pirellulaceae bacterium]|nr:carboxypeptidase regulatory-like domain-containing protein [Pirellulaceae bacterium]